MQLGQQLWTRPVFPHPDDEEFESKKLGDEWSAFDFNGVRYIPIAYGEVDAYDTSSGTGQKIPVEMNGSKRPSWAVIQSPNDSRSYYIHRAYTLPTNLLVIARLKFLQTHQPATAQDRAIGIAFIEDVGGYPDRNSYVICHLNQTSAPTRISARFLVRVNGSLTHFPPTDDVDSQGQALEYVAIHKLGTTFHGFIGTASGDWIYMGSSTQAVTLPYLGIMISNNTSTDPGKGMTGVDFIRFRETDNFLF